MNEGTHFIQKLLAISYPEFSSFLAELTRWGEDSTSVELLGVKEYEV